VKLGLKPRVRNGNPGPMASPVEQKPGTRVAELTDPGTDGAPSLRLRPMLLAAGLCALLTLPVAWNARQHISSDGLSYFEIAHNAIEISPEYLVSNAYWSPAYPALLAVTLKLARPALASELAVVHSIDWAIYVATCFCFTYFLFNLFRWIRLERGQVRGYAGILTFACTLLFVSNIVGELWLVRPDVLLEGVVFFGAGILIRLGLPGPRLMHYGALGAVLALAYATKAAFFPLSLILLAILFVRPVACDAGRKGIMVATAVFLLAASPLIAALSYTKGRLTFGDVGPLAVEWYVNAAPDTLYWEGRLPDSGILLHPAKKVSTDPVILKFDGPSSVTWPFWYDPSYWYDGVKPHFSLRQLTRRLLFYFRAARDPIYGPTVFDLAGWWGPMLAGVSAFVVLGLRVHGVYGAIGRNIWLLLWPVLARLMFACVLIQRRYVVSFVVLGWTALFAAAAMAMESGKSLGITVRLPLVFS
jgi:hypothetical protein